MLGRKYVFESKSTRIHRLLFSGLFLTFLTLAIFASFIAYIPIYAKMQKGRAAGVFFQKSPDIIAVFTGDKGRIAYALELLKKNPTSRLFISGVYAANSFETLVANQATDINKLPVNVEGIQVDLDYESKNTFGNVKETVEFLQKNPELNNVLIISSDYHILRIKMIMNHLMQNSKTRFYFDSIPSKFSSWKENKKLLKEAVKILRTFVVLKIFREDIIKED